MPALTSPVGQQLDLSVFGLQDVVLSAPRVGILSANKEGIVSLMGLFSVPLSEPVLIVYGLGYLAVHLLGLSTGTMIDRPSYSYDLRMAGSSLPMSMGAHGLGVR